MLEKLSTKLAKAIEQKRLKRKLEHEVQSVTSELDVQSTRLEALNQQLEKEEVDVAQLENMSLTAVLHTILGSREEKLEKDRQELVSAQISYQQCKRQVDYLEREKERLLEHLDALAAVESVYESLLGEKEAYLLESDLAVAAVLMEISEQAAVTKAEGKEIREAISVGNQALSGLDQLVQTLESAKSWGTWDMIGGGIIATAVKHSEIDKARECIQEVQTQMDLLSRELADVDRNVELQIDITELDTFADYFLDNLIIDWMIQSKIEDSLAQTTETRDSVRQVVKRLEEMNVATHQHWVDLQAQREHLIEGN